jgi:hypothetical protein
MPADVAGSFTIHYGGIRFVAQLARDGTYSCQWSGQPWVGRWSLAAGEVHVEEWCAAPRACPGPSNPLRWRFRLQRDRWGKFERDGVTLLPPASRR